MYDDYGDDYGFPDVTELNVSKGSVTVTTGEEESSAVINIDSPASAAKAVDYWSLTGMAAPALPGQPPFENILDQFASYAPLWTLACLSPNQYNNPQLYRGNPAVLEQIIFSSAGRFDSQRTQTVIGAPEYFVNNFEMKMTTTSSEKTGLTNLINMSFDVYEPYSMSYFIQSLQAAAIESGYPNYNGTPFLLMLEFVGHRDNGQMFASTEALKKYFTIQIKKVTFTTNEGGTIYKVEAAPYNHTGFTNIAQQITKDIKIRGENVKEMLTSGDMSLCNVLNNAEIEMQKSGKQLTADRYLVVYPENWSDAVGLPGEAAIPEEFYGSAVVDPDRPISSPLEGRRGQNTMNFGIGEVGRSSLGFGATSGGNFSFGFEGDTVDEASGLVVRRSLRIDPKLREFQFTKGATVQNIVQEIVLSSEYAKQALDPSKMDRESGRIKWFRIDVQIEIGAFDTKRGLRQRTYIFRVMPFYVHSSVFRAPGTNPPGYKKLNELCAKEYHYIYTGKNNNVIKFDIQINQLFNNGMNPTPLENTESAANPGSGQIGEDPDRRDTANSASDPGNLTTIDSTGSGKTLDITNKSTKGGYGAQTVQQKVAQMMLNTILKQGSTGDLTKVNLEIIGDPYWMTDTGLGNYVGSFYGEEGGRNQGPYVMVDGNGGMNYQGSDIYIRIVFATPIEPNLGTSGQGGLYSFPKGRVNPYSGLYKVIHCNSSFKDGKFTQVLECTRMPNQPMDFEGGYEVDFNIFPNDNTLEDMIGTSPNSDSPEYRDEAEDLNLLFGDMGPTGDPLTDEEIAANNASLGDFEG
jgi:hypothetical protein